MSIDDLKSGKAIADVHEALAEAEAAAFRLKLGGITFHCPHCGVVLTLRGAKVE